MSHYALWIDHNHAFLYHFALDGVKETKFEDVEHVDRHKYDPKDMKHKHYEKFFHTLANKIIDAQELVVMGPGVAKDQFKHHCEDHHKNLAKAIVGILPMTGHPTSHQMKSKAKEFFKNHHMFTKNY